MIDIWEVLRPFNDPVNFVGSIVGVLGAVVSIAVWVNQNALRRQLRDQEARGEHYPRVRFQSHTLRDFGDATVILGIVGLGDADLDRVMLSASEADAVLVQARRYAGSSAIFRMPTKEAQDRMYRDFVSMAGTLIRGSEPRIMTILCEKGDGVERFLLRPALLTLGQCAVLRTAGGIVTQAGKETQTPRISAVREMLDMIDETRVCEGSPVAVDENGFVIGHFVLPAG